MASLEERAEAKRVLLDHTQHFVPTQDLEAIYISTEAIEWLDEIERIARDAFSDPDTRDINLYRAQALAKIYQIFEYDGATIERSGKDEW